MYELHVWNGNTMPGQELAIIQRETLPKVGFILGAFHFPGSPHVKPARIVNSWPLGCKREWPDDPNHPQRHTVLVEPA